MKVPKYIKNRMRRVAANALIVDFYMREIEEWLEANGFNVEELRDGSGCSLEELEYGIDITEELCERIESI